ncbi:MULTISPECIES: potassium channel family protein [unclassified Heyndrickxia]|uniref:potassium channel family protein n=1 Tax=unclassified Heyndrickxia TaxID=2837518 RepID=UPI0030F966DF
MNAKINRLHPHIIVCGYSRVGKQVISQLEKEGKPLVVIEKNSQELENTSNLLYITEDATDDDVLISAGIKRADCLVLALPKDSDNVFITLTVKGMNPDIWIVTRAEKHESERKLYSAGADKVINTASIGGHRIACQCSVRSALNWLKMYCKMRTPFTVLKKSLSAGNHRYPAGP